MAKAFKFRLEAVLTYRRHLEEEKKRDLAERRRAVMKQNQLLLGLLQAESQGKNRIGEMKGERAIQVSRVRIQEQYLNTLNRKIRKEYQGLHHVLLAEAEARRILAEARKQVRVLEKLKERKVKAYHYELNRLERKEMDEVASRTVSSAGGYDS